jgi:GntR family transcriptional regulator/MocR family aminotransferase
LNIDTLSSAQWPMLDRASGDLEGQVYRMMRDRILRGQIAPGQRLPSTRRLAGVLGVARSTAVQAYERLRAEGYVEASTGSVTRVAAFEAPVSRGQAVPAPAGPSPISEARPAGLFEPGVPDISGFPHAAWARCLGTRGRALRVHDLGYGAHSGLPELREAILDHVASSRGVVARAEQVLIVPSTVAAIDLLTRLSLRLEPSGGRIAWIEEPGYATAHALLRAAGAQLLPVPCDDAGIDVSKAADGRPRLIYVTPSHQYPTGVTMALARRLALLEAAQAHGALVIEDDYDSEFQYASRPIAALQGIDRSGVVAYLGTFSKTLAPGLRIAYAIVPARLLPEAVAAQRLQGAVVPIHMQAALADFIREGRFRAHLRRMNAVYAVRMAATVAALRRYCGDVLDVADGTGGLQLAAWFRDRGTDDAAVVRRLDGHGFAVRAMSSFHIGAPRPGLLLGISRMVPEAAGPAVERLACLLPAIRRNGSQREPS